MHLSWIHRIVGIEVSQNKCHEKLDMQPRRPLKELTAESFKEEFNNEAILQHSKLDQIWESFNSEVKRTLDKLVPEHKPKKKAKPARPWYNSRLLEQKRIVRNRENKYIKYRQDHQWKAFTRERNRYTTMLNFSKRASIVNLVHTSQNDSKKLFRLVNKLLGKKNSNPMPPARTPAQLCEDFATFFKGKIDKIKDQFLDRDPYQPSRLDTPQLGKSCQ